MIKLKNNNPKGNSRNGLLGVVFIYFTLTSFAGFLLISVYNMFVANPTVTSLESTEYPVSRVPYPGISLCNINKISKKRAMEVADYMMNRTGESKDRIMQGIKFLGYLYESSFDVGNKAQIDSFQMTLDKAQMTISTIMRKLSTPCEELLQTCHWKGVEVQCSEIFQLRLTFEGYCCTFNYVKNTTEWWMRRDNDTEIVLQYGHPGLNYGLSVIINNNPDDYFFTSIPSTGINVHVFIPTDYPDKTSGGLIESLAEIGSENFLEVIPSTVAAIKDVMNYPVDKRNCLFEVEQQTQFGVYSQSDCFVDCRVKSMMTLCECIPFTIPFSDESNVCTLLDLPCLSKYQTKWTSLAPDYEDRLNMKEFEEGLYCSQTCYPSCEATLYEVVSSNVPLHHPEWKNLTVIHIYYGSRYHNLFFQDVVHYWFEILSSYGGIVGLIMGLSFISVVEGAIHSVKLIISRW